MGVRSHMARTADIAILGFSFKLPQDVDNDAGFWDVLQKRKNLMTHWPESRLNASSFVDDKHTKAPDNHGQVHCRGGHFIKEDVAAFDAPFFFVTAKEAASMDPMQRWTLETSYRAFENAGIPIERLKDSRTAVFSASMTEDWARMVGMDPDNADRTVITGTVASLIPNRVSFYFGLRGPSIHVDTACSSGLSAIDMACKVLRDGDASSALVTGSNLILDPSAFQMLSSQNFLSPDSLCYSFDHRANGYARGEGVIAFVLKPLSAAVHDGDMIRAVIRSTASNQDGHTPGLTQPSPQAQEDLIRHVYKKANLSLDQTRYIEAHGTGTPIGDPIEIKAIGRVFRKCRSAEEPLYVGSVKGNIGHLEGASGLAGILKSILILEKGIIPPNANFEKINPELDVDFYNIEVPTANVPWPSAGLRRVSVNSFGFGGSNTHVVLDDAFHYLQDRGLSGNHCTIPLSMPNGAPTANGRGHGVNGVVNGSLNGYAAVTAKIGTASLRTRPSGLPKLLVWSAVDKKAVERTTLGYETFYAEKVSGDAAKLRRLAFTLAARRSQMLWRTFAIINDGPEGLEENLAAAKPIRSSTEAGLAFVFTGQGAQYVEMGWDLLQYPVFSWFMHQIDEVYGSLGCQWSIFDELRRGGNIDKPEYSQPLSTAIQIALSELLKSFGVVPKAVVGHSSGEIAAAYAVGALSLLSACKVSYFRGQLAGRLRLAQPSSPAAMMSVNLAEDQVAGYLQSTKTGASISIACVNSPMNCTLSGSEDAIDAVKAQADKEGIFAQKLKTGVAYHSRLMLPIADEYLSRMGSLDAAGTQSAKSIPMVSSVTGKVVRPAVLATGQYWVDNMVSRVLFADAVQLLTQHSSTLKVGLGSITDLVEIGPHPTLKRAVLDTVGQAGNRKKKIGYASALHRSRRPVQSTLELAGLLYCLGHDISIPAVNQECQPAGGRPPPFLVDCPEYPFDHSQRYWAESRLSRDFRLREPVSGETLGMRVSDWNPLEPRWRSFLTVESMPWIGHHVVSDTVLYPAAGMLIMAMEAVKQMVPVNRYVAGYLVKEAHFVNPIIVREAWEDRIEVQVHLRPVKRQQYEKESTWSDITIMSYYRDRWTECFRATIQIHYQDSEQVDGGEDGRLANQGVRSKYRQAAESCTLPIDSHVYYQDSAKHGLEWGDWFQVLQDVFWDATKAISVARVDTSKAKHQTTSLVHPAILDVVFHMLRISAGQQPVTNVPVRLSDAWFAASGWQHPQTSSIRWMGTSYGSSGRGKTGEQGSVFALADDGSVLCAIQEAATAAVSMAQGDEAGASKKKLIHTVEWKPQLSLLNARELVRVCHADTFTKNEIPILAAHTKVCSMLDLITARTLARFNTEMHLAKMPENLRRHVEWMERHTRGLSLSQRKEASAISDDEVEVRLREIEILLPTWKLYTVVARNLSSILSGEVDPLQIIFESDLASIFYADVFENICADGRLTNFLDLAAHENPALRILEVGAGTGGVTGHVIRALQDRETRTCAPSFAEYTYTDISPVFLEAARSRWPELQSRMTFKTLNLEKDIGSQGFEPGSYDLIVAGSVLHATAYLEDTLRNVRTALKPGGHLVLLEVIDPEDIATNFWTGLVPGWWVAHEEWRPYSAAVPENQWDTCLRVSGFSGNDLIIRDYQNDKCHFMSIIVSTASQESTEPCGSAAVPSAANPKPNLVLIVDDDNDEEQHLEEQKCLANLVLGRLNSKGDRQASVRVFSLDQLAQANLANNTIVICLAEVNKRPLLASLSNERFQCLQYLVKQAPRLLWATATSAVSEQYPHYSAVQGFLRTIRCEQPDSQIVTVAIEGPTDAAACAQFIARAFTAVFESPSASKELEYVVRHGQILTGRAVEDAAGMAQLRSLLSPQLQHKAWKEGPALQLEVGTPGTLDSLRFVQDATHETELGPCEVEIEAKAWGLNFRDVLIALGREDEDELGADCAGIVTRLGRDCSASLKAGDRVCMVAEGCMRQYPRAHEARLLAIPDTLSFESAASILVPGLTAYHCLVDVARLQKGESILIHSAAGSTGQMAVRVAQMLGVHVLATTSSPEKKKFLIDTLGIPEDCIFHSRTTSFAQGVMRVTKGYGVDCVLNSLSGDGLRASWDCMAPFGRFIDIGHADINANATLPMAMFSRNVSFSAVHLMWLSPSVTAILLKNTLQLLEEGKIQPPQPLHVFKLPKIEQAFRYLQSGKNVGRIVLTPTPDDVIPQFVRERRLWTLDENASYLISGGSGGLGRATLRWMVDRGAKHLIVPSRSGATSKAAAKLVAELMARGVNVVAPKCDVSSETSLATVLAECRRTMPPIKGCINSAMVLQDAIFENMTFAQWDLTMRSKVQTSWNLHRLLPQDLDFFILFSSLAGVVGQSSSANYGAGCSFQDALAHHRIACGQRALSIDIGWMRNIGIIAETAAYQRRRQTDQDLQSIDNAEFLALLTLCCDPTNPLPQPSQGAPGQVLFGLRTPADFIVRGQTPLAQFDRPLFATYAFVPSLAGGASLPAQADQPAALFRQATDSGERMQVVLRTLADKLAVAMSISPGDVEPSKPLSSYGVDSLMAVELKNWVGREFGATVAVFDIMGGLPISSVADLVVERSAVKSVI
ncbi:putative polyketide synthase [Xylariales sp. AK1849]|nr:putative polyketide synthase [Xylariales sp. AK1849]